MHRLTTLPALSQIRLVRARLKVWELPHTQPQQTFPSFCVRLCALQPLREKQGAYYPCVQARSAVHLGFFEVFQFFQMLFDWHGIGYPYCQFVRQQVNLGIWPKAGQFSDFGLDISLKNLKTANRTLLFNLRTTRTALVKRNRLDFKNFLYKKNQLFSNTALSYKDESTENITPFYNKYLSQNYIESRAFDFKLFRSLFRPKPNLSLSLRRPSLKRHQSGLPVSCRELNRFLLLLRRGLIKTINTVSAGGGNSLSYHPLRPIITFFTRPIPSLLHPIPFFIF